MDHRLQRAVDDHERLRQANQKLSFMTLFNEVFKFWPAAYEPKRVGDNMFEFAGEVWSPLGARLFVKRMTERGLFGRKLVDSWYHISTPRHYAKLVDGEPLTDGREL